MTTDEEAPRPGRPGRGVVAMEEFLQTKNVMIDFPDEERDPFAIKP